MPGNNFKSKIRFWERGNQNAILENHAEPSALGRGGRLDLIIEKLNRMNFDKKMKLFIFFAIVLTATIILLASTASYISVLSKTSLSLIESQIHAISNNLQSAIMSYGNTAIAITMDDSVQQYLKSNNGSNEYKADALRSLGNILNMQSDMNFISVIKNNLTDYVYRGSTSLTTSQFYDRYAEDFNQSRYTGAGGTRINFQSAYYNNNPYALSIYRIIYDSKIVNEEIGILCFSVSEPMLRQILDTQNPGLFDLYLIDGSGTAVSCSDWERIGENTGLANTLKGNKGVFRQDGRLYIYEKTGSWDYYVVGTIPEKELYRDGIRTILYLFIAIIFMVAISLIIGTKIVKRSYYAMDEIVMRMDDVSKGQMDVSMNENTSGDDFAKIAQGFNAMMNQLNNLVEQVKQEQHQIEQIKLHTLQAQIKPHFLYNTLECIHWQAAMDGNQTISKLVRALATYYRICLSNGQDVIQLSQELQHIENYLIIQNMRYGDIISCEIMVKPEFGAVSIPKMTLQPLVENSIYHGIKIKDGKTGLIVIDAKTDGDDVVVTVEDNGSGMEQSRLDEVNKYISVYDESFGYGVRNVNKRIELTFGENYGLYYMLNKKGGVTVEIRLPAINIPYEEPQDV